MTEDEFRAPGRQGYNRIPLVLESFADLDTPLSLYVKLANARYTFLLERTTDGPSDAELARALDAALRQSNPAYRRAVDEGLRRQIGGP